MDTCPSLCTHHIKLISISDACYGYGYGFGFGFVRRKPEIFHMLSGTRVLNVFPAIAVVQIPCGCLGLVIIGGPAIAPSLIGSKSR